MKLSDSGNPVSNKQITDLEEKISAKLPKLKKGVIYDFRF